MVNNNGSFTASDGNVLHWQSWHAVKGMSRAAVVLVHGLGDHSGGLSNIAEYLVSCSFSCYGMDLRGHGLSKGPRGHVDKWAQYHDDLAAFIEIVRQKENAAPLFLVGHSLGGLIATDFALRYSNDLSGVIAICPAYDFNGTGWLMQNILRCIAILNQCFSIDLEGDINELTNDPMSVQRLSNDKLRHNKLTAGLLREIFRGQHHVSQNIGSIRTAFLLIHGTIDRITTCSSSEILFKALLSDKNELYKVVNAAHRPFDDVERAAVLEKICGWIGKKAAG